MKLIRVLFVLALAGAAIAVVQRMMEEPPPSQQDIWKPADPLAPHPEPEV